MEALVGILLRRLSADAVNTRSLAIVDGRLTNALDSGAQVVVERAEDRTADGVA